MSRTVKVFLGVAAILLSAAAAHAGQVGLPPGSHAPDFRAKTYNGKSVRLSKYYKRAPVVLIFYRGGWCPYCNRHLQALQESLGEFTKRGVKLIAVSVDKPEKEADTVAKHQLGFPVISDPGAGILKLYNVTYTVPAELVKTYKEKYNIDLEAASGRTEHVIAVPAVYIIDTSGIIVYVYANEDYKVRKSPEEILGVLDILKLGGAAHAR